MSELTQGIIDMHIHTGPSVAKRSVDGIEMFKMAKEAGYKGFAMKEHYLPTQFEATLLNKHYRTSESDPIVYGVYCINGSTGLFNLIGIDAAVTAGAKIIVFPTVTSKNHIDHHQGKFPGSGAMTVDEAPLVYVDDKGELSKECVAVLEYIAARPELIIMTGHGTVPEIDALINKAVETGCKKIIVNHPQFHIGATIEDMVRWAKKGCYIEINACVFEKTTPNIAKERLPISLAKEMIDACGIDNIIVDSDLGQTNTSLPVIGLSNFLEALIEGGVTREQVDIATKINPAKLVG